MRTTIRLPDEVYRQVRLTAVAGGGTVTAFIEAAVRSALAAAGQASTAEPYRVAPFRGDGLQRGVDLDDNASLEELLDAGARP